RITFNGTATTADKRLFT
ncbi:unnamed protein product, partial [Allacma fusca]